MMPQRCYLFFCKIRTPRPLPRLPFGGQSCLKRGRSLPYVQRSTNHIKMIVNQFESPVTNWRAEGQKGEHQTYSWKAARNRSNREPPWLPQLVPQHVHTAWEPQWTSVSSAALSLFVRCPRLPPLESAPETRPETTTFQR